MIENKRVYTVISAAGSGRRMGAPIPKQFIVNRGRTILEQTVERFAGNNMVDKVILVVSGSWREYCEKLFAFSGYKEKLIFTEGGAKRQDKKPRASGDSFRKLLLRRLTCTPRPRTRRGTGRQALPS